MPGRGADPLVQLGLGAAGHRAAGVRDDQDALDAEQVDAEHQRLERLGRDPAAGVAEDLGVAGLQPDHPQRVDPGVHAGHDRDAGVRDAVEAGQLEAGGEVAVGGEQVVEVDSTAAEISRKAQPAARSRSPVDTPRVAAPRNRTSASRPATTAQTAAPVKTVCSWAMPAILSDSVNSAQRVAPSHTSRAGGRSACLGVVAAQPDRGERGDADQHPDHPGHDHERAGQAVHVVVGAGQHRGVDRRQGQAEAEPAQQQRHRRDRVLEALQPPGGHPQEAGGRAAPSRSR